MNRRRLAAIFRRLAEIERERAELHDEMADAMTEENDVPTMPRRRGGSTKAPVLPPENSASPELRAKALRRLTGARP